MVQAKQNSTVGDVLLAGKAAVDLAQTVTDAKRRPTMGPLVLFNYGDGTVFVQASLHDFIEDHVHFQFTLTCLPAGDTTPPDVDADHTIENADDALPGWLPADAAVFAGLAPAGAVWGYNLSQHAALRAVWPPQPMTAATLIWDRGSGGTVVPATLAVCNRDGIWWLSDCFGEVPWPVDLNTLTSSSSLSDSSSSGEGPPCGSPSPMQLTLWFTQMLFGTDQTSVTSLTSANTERLAFRNCRGEPATTGDLIAEVLTDLVVDEDPEESSLAFVRLDGTTLHIGRLTEGLLAGAGVSLSSSHPQKTDAGVLHRGRIARGGAASVCVDVTSTMRGRLLDLGTLVRACHKVDTSPRTVDFEPTHGGIDRIEVYDTYWLNALAAEPPQLVEQLSADNAVVLDEPLPTQNAPGAAQHRGSRRATWHRGNATPHRQCPLGLLAKLEITTPTGFGRPGYRAAVARHVLHARRRGATTS